MTQEELIYELTKENKELHNQLEERNDQLEDLSNVGIAILNVLKNIIYY